MTQQQYTTARERRGPFDELQRLFQALDDGDLVAALQATRWTGRPGYPIRVMWRTLVASFYLGIIHDTDLVRALRSNPLMASACGIQRPKDVPSKFAYCRFRKKLITFNDLVAKILSQCVETLKDALPDFGATVAVDATDVRAWANGLHQETDPDAGTGAKHKSSRRFYWYAYKVHLAADAISELPISFTVTRANVYDGKHLAPVLKEAQRQYDWFQPAHVLADKGYDAKACFQFVGEDMQAIPVIDVQKTRAKKARDARPCEAMPVITPTGTHYRCERLPYDPLCTRFGKCPLLPMFVDSPLNQATAAPYFEQYSPFPYGSKEWKTLYNKRVSVERVFGRLKGYRKLNAIRTRGMAKVWLHVALSVLTMNAAAVVNAASGNVRKCVA
ncbi:MAG: transposase [Chloroflexi bacterium]|nr:transposase [Chloroflexota bacterium]